MSSFMGSETSETRRMNKFERALLRFPVAMAWNGANLYDGATQLRRVRTQAMNEQSEHLPKVAAHYDQLIHAGELCLAPMLQNKLEDIKVHITAAVVADDPAVQPDQKLPKKNFMEWCCRNAADHMPPIHSPPTDDNWKSCFKMVALYKEGEKVAYSVDAPEAWCDLYSSDDMSSGHPIEIFSVFWETHVLSPLFGDPEGENVNRSRICDIADHLLEHTATYPEEYSTDRMKSFQARMRSMLLLFGKTPFQRGAKIEDLRHFDQGTTELQAAMKSGWAGKLWSSAFMRNAGEVEAEPEITRAEKLMESDSSEDQTRGLESVIEKYVGWSLHVRQSWLERSIQDRVVKLLGGRVEQSGAKALTDNDSHAASILATPENMKLVSLVSDISSLWSDLRVSMMKQSLAVISCAIERRDAVAAFVKGIEDAVISEDTSSTSLEELCAKVIPTLPGRSMVLLLTSGDDQAKVASFLVMLTKCATNMLPATLPHLAALMKGICNKVEMEAQDEDSSEALTSSTAITLYDGEKAKATHYFDLTQLQDLNSKYQGLGGTEHSRFTSDASHKMIEQMEPLIARMRNDIVETRRASTFVVEMLTAANKHLEGHTKLAISEANEPLTSSMKLLQRCAGGVADGKEWKTILAQEDPSPSPKMLFSKLEHLTKDTLQKVDTQILVQRILETHTVWMCCS